MDPAIYNERWVLSRRDWSGQYATHWTITPTSQEGDVDVVVPDDVDCVPLYPLRYGLTEESCRVDSLGNLSVAEYPGGPEGKTYGLRLLRPRSIVYLFYMDGDELQHLVYQVTEDVCFSPLPQELAAKAAEKSEFGDQDDFLFPMGAVITPWLPAPKIEVTNTIYLMVTDTLLTTETIDSLTGRLDELSGQVLTRVRTDQLAEGQRDVLPISGTLDDGRYVPEMQGELHYIRNPANLSWSESRPEAPNGSLAVSTLNRFFKRFNGEREDIEPLAVVLHDPVGVMSELNHRLATQLTALSEYCRDNARKLRVKEMIERLGDARYSELYDRHLKIGVDEDIREAVREQTGVDLSPEVVADAQGQLARNQRLSNYRAQEAGAFEQEFQQRLKELAQQVETAAAEQWNDWQGLQERYHAMLELYDETDDTNYLDLRVVVAHTLTGLFHDEQGQEYLKAQLDGERPLVNSLFYRALLGHPLVEAYVSEDATTAKKRFDEALAEPQLPMSLGNAQIRTLVDNSVGEALSRLQRVLNQLPDDAASAQLGMVVTALTRPASGAATTFWPSSWRAMLEILFGEAVIPEQVPASKVGSWFAHVAGGSTHQAFRPTEAANDPLYLLRTQKLDVDGSSQYTPLKAALKAHVHFWHGAKGFLGGLGMWASLDSVGKAIRQWGDKDGQALANSLNLGSAMLAVGASGTGLLAAGAGWSRDVRMVEQGREASRRAAQVADRVGNWAIAFAAASALLASTYDYILSREESGDARTLTLTGSLMKFGQTGVGAAHLLGKARSFNRVMGTAVEMSGNTLLTRGIQAGSSAALRVTAISASTVGWVILGLDALYTGIRAWHDQVVAEQKFTDWIGRSYWGTGNNSDGYPLQDVFGQNEVEELRQFYRLFQAPHFEVEHSAPIWDPAMSGVVEDGHTEVTVIFPGWQPQVSQFQLIHHSKVKVATRLSDSTLVESKDGYGKLTYQTWAMGDNIEISYWPNRFADEEFILYDEATEKQREQERREQLEKFNARQKEQGSAP
ncbi:toxin VasX [Halomonas binhaiensis]|uniref:Toxin VasX N-terminal region domain-containing protein n=1 Tax=Halomonas binhaiensis TaxID=2562282 RepID=A0A5C1NK42_9GAMM|nr:toxin VasX [Halomonas binhaiensis]QEM82717.1 hypothetical protein E4T21_15050 [Halomonas binhaiensis]